MKPPSEVTLNPEGVPCAHEDKGRAVMPKKRKCHCCNENCCCNTCCCCTCSCFCFFKYSILSTLTLISFFTVYWRWAVYDELTLNLEHSTDNWEGYIEYEEMVKDDFHLTKDFNETEFILQFNGTGDTVSTELIDNHCGKEMLVDLFHGRIDEEHCGTLGKGYISCLPGYYSKRLSATNDTESDWENLVDAVNSTNATVESVADVLQKLESADVYGPIEACPAGFFCPENFVCIIICALGSFCPQSQSSDQALIAINGTRDAPVMINPTRADFALGSVDCLYPDGVDSDQSALVSASSEIQSTVLCPGSRFQYLCPAGRYCPNSVRNEVCPEEEFCRKGVSKSETCNLLMDCNDVNNEAPSFSAYWFVCIAFLLAAVVIIKSTAPFVSDFLVDMQISKVLAATGNGDKKAAEAEAEQSNLELHLTKKHFVSNLMVVLIKLRPFARAEAELKRLANAIQNIGTLAAVKKPGDRQTRLPLKSIKELQDVSLFSEKLETRMDVAFQDLGLVLNSTGRCVLDAVTGSFLSGDVTAIMGPSGSGKTTFLNTLAGRASYGQAIGRVRINGQEGATIQDFSYFCGFVPQDDIMLPEITVYETLLLYASLRLPKQSTHADISRVVMEVVEVLGLLRVVDSVIGDATTRGISGGQKKRVNIGIEMVSLPSVLFLDEPTSGLDSTTSYTCVRALSDIAQKGVNVALVVHQPSYQLFQLLSHVLFLGFGGRTVYLGRTANALEYFEACGFECPALWNPADFLMDIIACNVNRPDGGEVTLDDLCGMWEKYACTPSNFDTQTRKESIPLSDNEPESDAVALGRALPLQDLLEAASKYEAPSFLMSTWLFLMRAWLQYVKQPWQIVTDLLLHMGAGIVVGALYSNVEFKKLQEMNFIYTFALGLTIGMSSLRVFGAERVVFWREAAPGAGMNLNRKAYFVAKNFAELPRLLALCAMLASFFFPMSSPRCPLSIHLLIILSGAYYVSGWAYLISIQLDEKGAQLGMVVVVLVFSMFSGVTPSLQEIDDNKGIGPMLAWLSYARWCIESLYINETERMDDAWRMPPTFLKSSRDSVLAGLFASSYTETVTELNVLVNFIFGTIVRVLAYYSLFLCNRNKMGQTSFKDIFQTIVYDFLAKIYGCARSVQ
ncbi:hypothetical protein CYMTET_6201 [Cymbomonas tetramitiformis]|uniref:ABC transporter domain-containing protein n=1 Tax=Cymbomonas tetramitiformis TaxID=36881 RepID=A0AAE0LIA9_9CHLO|nr:hypothetical protein CYMTET_6201 [Cymbomonas tetramitiformis]